MFFRVKIQEYKAELLSNTKTSKFMQKWKFKQGLSITSRPTELDPMDQTKTMTSSAGVSPKLKNLNISNTSSLISKSKTFNLEKILLSPYTPN